MGYIGYFSVSLQGPPVMKKKDMHAQSIELKNINYRSGKLSKKELNGFIEGGLLARYGAGKQVVYGKVMG